MSRYGLRNLKGSGIKGGNEWGYCGSDNCVMSKVWMQRVTVHLNELCIGDLVTAPHKHRGAGRHRTGGPPKVYNTKICCGSFGLNFILMTRRHYSRTLLWDLGGTSLIITERLSGVHKFSENLVESTAGAQTNGILTFVVRYFGINSVLLKEGTILDPCYGIYVKLR